MKLPIWFDEMGYGNPSEGSIKRVEKVLKGGMSTLPILVDFPKFPKNSSKETLEELLFLYELQEEERPFMEALIEKADYELFSLFREKCAEYQINNFEDQAESVMEIWGALSTDLKMNYNRARPFQLAPYYDIPLYPMKSTTAWGSAYPSGHTLQAEALANFYTYLYPELEDEWRQIARAISHTRLVGGFHYPSDILASETIVKALWNDDFAL